LRVLRFEYQMFTLQTSLKPLLLGGVGGRLNLLVEVIKSKEENSYFCPNYVHEFGLSYFTSPFAIAKRLEMRFSVSPAVPFLDASLPNHTKMFELVHVVTSIDDFERNSKTLPT
jgi:hypothetical protein